MSFPDRNTVEVDDNARSANNEDELATDASRTVITFGKVFLVNASGDTGTVL